jgi:hypothetical protein
MTLVPALRAKHHILSRRVASLSSELEAWVKWAAAGSTLERNFSQIEALDYFMRALCKLNEDGVNALNPDGDVDVFLSGALDLGANVVKSHVTWNFFRDRLELRFVPQFQQSLHIADLISHDCYTTVMERAEALQIVPAQGFRAYPLIGLASRFSPVTWPRGRRPKALQNRNLPVPVIDLPWDHMVNPWELLTIAHEVGHDVDQDLGKLSRALQPVVASQLGEIKTPAKRIAQWKRWTSEILADLVGMQLTGPAFAGVLAELLTLPKHQVRHIRADGKHPPHYLRVLINTVLARRMGLSQAVNSLEADWKTLYGEPGDDFGPYLPDVEPVVSAILDTPLAALQGREEQRHSLDELVVFAPSSQECIQEAAAKLAAGAAPGELAIRHVVSSSQLAFEQMMGTGDAAKLESLARHTRQTIIALTPPKRLRAGLASGRVRRRLDELARTFFEYSLDDFDVQ